MAVRRAAPALLLAALALAACENIPYYDESLDLFSRSHYDPEVKAIEEQTPPPQDSPVLSTPIGDGASAEPVTGGAIVAAASLEGERPAVAASPGDGDATSASLPPRQRITPPMGFARSKRVIYGSNRGPFQTGNVRTLR